MHPLTLSARQTQILLLVTLVAVDRFLTPLTGAAIPGLGAEGGLLLLWAIGHCDTLDGPLAGLAKKALEENNLNLVLPWVRPEDGPEIHQVFDHAQAVRSLGPEARTLADRHFLETLIRVHRAGEGAAFSGLKPAGLDLGPAVPAADRALETGSPDEVIKLLLEAVSRGVITRFQAASGRRDFDRNDVPAGRKYVEAYVPYIHYVERLWEAATGEVHGHYAEHGPHEGGHAEHDH